MQLFLKILSGMASSVDPDQTASKGEGAVSSGSPLIAYGRMRTLICWSTGIGNSGRYDSGKGYGLYLKQLGEVVFALLFAFPLILFLSYLSSACSAPLHSSRIKIFSSGHDVKAYAKTPCQPARCCLLLTFKAPSKICSRRHLFLLFF